MQTGPVKVVAAIRLVLGAACGIAGLVFGIIGLAGIFGHHVVVGLVEAICGLIILSMGTAILKGTSSA